MTKQSNNPVNIAFYHALRLAYIAGQKNDWPQTLDVLRDLAEDTRTFPKLKHSGNLHELREKIKEIFSLVDALTPPAEEQNGPDPKRFTTTIFVV